MGQDAHSVKQMHFERSWRVTGLRTADHCGTDNDWPFAGLAIWSLYFNYTGVNRSSILL